jgi:flagellar biosynthesis protein FlgN
VSVDPIQCRDLASRLLDEEAQTLIELETLLAREHQILIRNQHAEALEDACAARQICMGTLLRIQEERRGLLRMLGLRHEPQSVVALLDFCRAEAHLRQRWADVSSAAQRCRDLNDRNGALVQSRIRRVAGMLEILTGQSRAAPVYGPRGEQGATRAGALLAAEA